MQPIDCIAARPTVRAFFEELTAAGYQDAAKRTAEVLDCMRRINELQLELYPVWAALDANDRSVELERAVLEWRAARPVSTLPPAGREQDPWR